MIKIKLNPKVDNKKCVELLIISLILTAILITIIQIRISNLNKERLDFLNDFEDDEDDIDIYYEYMVDKVADKIGNIDNIDLLKEKIRKINKEQLVHRRGKLKVPLQTAFVIVVQIHHKVAAEYFIELLLGLKYARGISRALIVFSHDYFDEEINELIERTNLTRYIQIYYPYSTQLFPDTFPGNDQTLCTNDFQCEESILRYELFVQKKHFWWWQMNHVFDELNVTRHYDKIICFLEANQFVLRDFIFVAKIMEVLMKEKCTECEILSLGMQKTELNKYNVNIVNLTKSSWDSNVVRAGFAFNRTIWNVIKRYSSLFCNYNDYRWEESLKYLSLNKDDGPFIFLSIDAPRIILYHKYNDNSEHFSEQMIEIAKNFANDVRKGLFPKKFNIRRSEIDNDTIKEEEEEEEKKAGGWEDDRDKGLCQYFVKS